MANRYDFTELTAFISGLFRGAGLAEERAAVLAKVFIEADLLGYTTHGTHRVASNLEWLGSGASRLEGAPAVLADHGNTFNWDAGFLPGPWVVAKALDRALARVPEHGVVTATIRRAQHIACLAAYCPRVIEAGYLVLLSCSTPAERTVSPFGGIAPVFSANPLAMAAPGQEYPLLFDISMSITAGGYVTRAAREGQQLAGAWLKDAAGEVTRDPQALVGGGGSIMPIGGADHGYKGAALAIATEVLSMALGGYGRANAESAGDGEANSVFLQVIDPAAFGSLGEFKRQLAALQALCEQSEVAPGDPPVRFPGQRAWQRRREQLAQGVELYPSIMQDLAPWAKRLGVAMPVALEEATDE